MKNVPDPVADAFAAIAGLTSATEEGKSIPALAQYCTGCNARVSLCWCGQTRPIHRSDYEVSPDGRRIR